MKTLVAAPLFIGYLKSEGRYRPQVCLPLLLISLWILFAFSAASSSTHGQKACFEMGKASQTVNSHKVMVPSHVFLSGASGFLSTFCFIVFLSHSSGSIEPFSLLLISCFRIYPQIIVSLLPTV